MIDAALVPITNTCTPRADVLSGGLSDNHFAAQLDQVLRNPSGYTTYGDPERFFALTYPTGGLRELLKRTFGRLAAATPPPPRTGAPGSSRGVATDHGLIRSETSFGGGKTHSLIAVYHLARGARPANVEEFVDPALLPHTGCAVAAVVGDSLDPVNGLLTPVPPSGRTVRTHTLWGEIGAQLGVDAFALLKRSDTQRTVPSTAVLGNAIGHRPTVIIIDELAQHLRQLASSGDPDVRRQAEAVPAFLKNLLEVSAAKVNLVVILTLASSQDAFAAETGHLADALGTTDPSTTGAPVVSGSDMADAGRPAEADEAFAETASVVARFTRGGSIVKPADDSEIVEILKRRLFEHINLEDAEAASAAYRRLYDQLTADERLPGGADLPAAYAAEVERSYPFHPELIRVLDRRLGTIPNFQRARGALKLLAEVVAGIWEGTDGTPIHTGVEPEQALSDPTGAGAATTAQAPTHIINVADLCFERDAVLHHLTVGLDRKQFAEVARVDFVGPRSYAAAVDAERFTGRRPYATRACRTVFAHSLERVTSAGAGRPDILLGTLAPGDHPDVVTEALAAVDTNAWHLDYSGNRWRFTTEPNANKIVAEAARDVANSRVNEELRIRVQELFPSDCPVQAVHYPASAGDIPDNPPQLRLVVLHHDDLTVTGAEAGPPAKIVDLFDHAGGHGGLRTNRNAVVFLAADAGAVDVMHQRVREDIGAASVIGDPERTSGFAPAVRERLQRIAGTAKLNARVAVCRCYRHLYHPSADRANQYLSHEELPTRSDGDVRKARTKVVLSHLQDVADKVRTRPMSSEYLRTKTWPRGAAEVTTLKVANAFWVDHGLPVVLDTTLLIAPIRDGVSRGSWVYWDATAQRTWGVGDPAPEVRIGEDSVLYTPARAAELRLGGRAPKPDDVVAALTGGVAGSRTNGRLGGAALRAALEETLGTEPGKGEVLAAVAGAADGGDNARAVVVAGAVTTGAKGLTPSETRNIGLDTVTVLTPAVADRIGVVRPNVRRGRRELTGRGAIGAALQKVLDEAADASSNGIMSIAVEAVANHPGGVENLAELARAVPRLPRHDIAVTCDTTAEFAETTGGR